MEVQRTRIRKPKYVITAYIGEGLLKVPIYETIEGDYFCGLLPGKDGYPVRFSGVTLADAVENYYDMKRMQ